MLLKNPADYKGGFWQSYLFRGQVYSAGSTESSTIALAGHETEDGQLKVVLEHSPSPDEGPATRSTIMAWSYNSPTLLLRYTTDNVSQHPVKDMRVFLLMDFDIGGSASYKDDVGTYDSNTDIITACDDSPLCVAMASRPTSDGHEIAAPIKLRIDAENRDLKCNERLGPQDIVTALQWNLGDMEPGQSRTVDVVIAPGENLGEVKDLIDEAWGLFDKRMQ